jgi:carbonic anhydrase/acetyltransferase-like protein (isoleucine patch superfamily)
MFTGYHSINVVESTLVSIRIFDNIWPTIHTEAYVDPQASVIGRVTLGANVSIWPFASVRGDLLPITIGDYSNIQDNSTLHTTQASSFNPSGYGLSIGQYVTVGHGVILHGCTLHNLILVGMGSIILDGAIIEDEVIIGAGSIVPPGKHLTSGSLWLGSPAKEIRKLKPEEIAFMKWNAEKYVETKRKYENIPHTQ